MAAGLGAKTLQEYLVSLGVKLDEKGMSKMEGFLKSSKMGFLALTGIMVTAATVATKWVKQINENELALAKEAKAQHKSIEAVRASENALKAMGKTKQEIAKDKSLKAVYDDLVKMNKAMALPDGSRGLALVRSISQEFLKFKSTIQYAMQWVNYHIISKLEGPLTRIRDTMKAWRERLQVEMPMWTAKIADGIAVFVRLLDTAVIAGGKVLKFLNDLPDGVKVAGTAIAGLWSIIRAGPLGWLLGGLTTLLLLLDDYWTWMKHDPNQPSLFAPLWEGLEDGTIGEKLASAIQLGMDKVEKNLDAFLAGIPAWIESHQAEIERAGKTIGSIIGGALGLMLIFSDALIKAAEKAEVWNAMFALGGAILAGLTSALEGAFDGIVDDFFKSWSDFMNRLPDWAKKLFGIYEDDQDKMASAAMAENGRLFDEKGDIISVEDSRKIFKEDPDRFLALQNKEKTEIYDTRQKIRTDYDMMEMPTGMMAWSNEYPAYRKLLDRFNVAAGEEEMKTIAQATKYFKKFWDEGMDRDEILKYAESALEIINKDFPPAPPKGQSTTLSDHGGGTKSFDEHRSYTQGNAETSDKSEQVEYKADVDTSIHYNHPQVLQATKKAIDVVQGAVEPIKVPMVPIYGADGEEEGHFTLDPDWGVKSNALGGRYDKPTKTTLVEHGETEYVIPIKKLNRAIPLIRMMLAEIGEKGRQMLSDFGITPDTDIDALVASKGLGRPGGGSPIINIVNNYNNTVTAPATIIVNGAGQDPQAVGQAAYNAQERFLVRTLKDVIQ